jgi:hypothetical protein
MIARKRKQHRQPEWEKGVAATAELIARLPPAMRIKAIEESVRLLLHTAYEAGRDNPWPQRD